MLAKKLGKGDKMPNESAVDTANAAVIWASSQQGQEAIDQAVQRALQTSEILDEARKVDFELIHRPLGMRL